MGYLLILAGVLLLAFVLFPLLSARRAARPRGGTLYAKRPVARVEPSADETTPGESSAASPRQQRDAERRTPPA